MSDTMQFSTMSHPLVFPRFRGGTDQGTRKMEDLHDLTKLNQHHHQLQNQEMRTLSSITTKIALPNPRDRTVHMVAVTRSTSRPVQSSSISSSTYSSFDMSSSASSTYSSEETGGDVSSAPTTPVSESVAPVFAIDMKAVDEKIGEALATPKASAVPKPTVEDVSDVEDGQEAEDAWQTDDDEENEGDYDTDETNSDDGSEWETESSGHEEEYDTEDDCGVVFGDSDDEDVDEEEDDGLFGYDSEGDQGVMFDSHDEEKEEEEEEPLPKLPNLDAHRAFDRPPLRPCLSHAYTSQPMKRTDSTGSRVRFSETAEKPQVIQTRVFVYSYYEFDNMVRSSECPNEIKNAFADQRTEMEKFQELHALREFYISLLDPAEQEKERANPSNAIVGKMEHFLISKMMEAKGEDVKIDDPEKCTQLLVGLVRFGQLKLEEEEEKEIMRERTGIIPPTVTPTETTPQGSDGEWETDNEETETECDSIKVSSKSGN